MSERNSRLFGTLRVQKINGEVRVGNRLFECVFKIETAGFPSALGFTGEAPLLNASAPMLSARLARGRRARPVLAKLDPHVTREGEAVRLVFDHIPWQDDKGGVLEGFRTALEYEFFPDGAVFVKTFFFTETVTPPALHALTLAPAVRIPAGEEAGWAYWTLPREITAKIIQDMGSFERNLPRTASRDLDGLIAPFVAFDYGEGGWRDKHAEFFVESWNALAGPPSNTSTRISWQGREATVAWDFQKKPEFVPGRAYQWRNTWGWCLRRFPVERDRAPLRVFHYLDNFERYPSTEVIRQVAATGANTFILHENWRFEAPNGEFPYDRPRMERMLRACRANGLRVGLYVRGNEHEIRERYAEPLRPFLRHNIDGIYMDFGSPMCFLGKEEEAPGGRIHFREYHRMTRAIRDFVGPEGFFISHSGSFFAACGHTECDTYLGGEQEKGQLIKNPTLHAYFSGLAVAPGSLWTAAFPTYRTPRMLPYLASTFQTPFLHLGTQFPTSSLAHPDVPSMVTFARPLWRLWELMDGEHDLKAYCTQGGPRVLKTGSARTGASLMVTRKGEALLVLANYSASPGRAKVRIDWRALGLAAPAEAVALTVRADGTGAEAVRSGNTFEAELGAFGIGGWLLTHDAWRWRKPLERFLRPVASAPRAEKAWQARIDTIKRLRYQPPAWKKSFLSVVIPNFPNSYEDSIWWDLFENIVELLERTGSRERSLGFVSRQGLVAKPPAREDFLMPGEPSPWIPLHRKLGTGRHRLVLATRRQGGEFYSFVKARLSPEPRETPATYEAVYTNELDLDWSRLTFDVVSPL